MQNASAKAYTLPIGVPKYGVMILAIVNLLLELTQLIRSRWRYFDLDNLLEVSIFVLALVTTVDTSWCMRETGVREVSTFSLP
ncbi:hypothetical protein AHF37_12214 [Paragonimus kellicotti]|nr:hypothetical protein AHF37_12214 [Paragonimus kellicotti]